MDTHPFFKNGWLKFSFDPVLKTWVDHALPVACQAVKAPENKAWLRCGGTWFAGVNVLNNNQRGQIESGPVLSGNAVDFIQQALRSGDIRWDQGQISVCYPGYPQPMRCESEAAFRYRLNRDAAHVDGLLPQGTDRRRHLGEYHGFILGIPLVKSNQQAAATVIWQGSHEIIRRVFKKVYAQTAPADWGKIDVTAVYHQVRQKIFKECERVTVSACPGECYLIHRLSLHGISPWREGAKASKAGRMICYFRPALLQHHLWLSLP